MIATARRQSQPHFILPRTVLDINLRAAAPKCRLTGRTVTIAGGSTTRV